MYADLSEFEQWLYTQETHLPPKTFELNYTNLFGNHRSSLKIGYEGKNYEKYEYIVTNAGRLFRYFGSYDIFVLLVVLTLVPYL